MADYMPSEETLRAVKQAKVDQHVASIADALDLNPDNDYAPKRNLWADVGLLIIGLLPIVCGIIGIWIISQL